MSIILSLCLMPFANAHIHLATTHHHEQFDNQHHHSHQQTHVHSHHDDLEDQDHHANLSSHPAAQHASHVELNNAIHFQNLEQVTSTYGLQQSIKLSVRDYQSTPIELVPQYGEIVLHYFVRSNVYLRAPPVY